MTESKKKGRSMTILKRVLQHAAPFSGWILLSILLSVVCAILSLVLPIIAGNAIDLLIDASTIDLAAVGQKLLQYVLIAVICAVAQWGMNSAANRIMFRIARDVREEALLSARVQGGALEGEDVSGQVLLLPHDHTDAPQTRAR
ncbi:MAG: hypothetical protein IJT34_05290, partial [Butyrivibrio sp.]|nr:hypothetical protein [Butyrivibrio sp.]